MRIFIAIDLPSQAKKEIEKLIKKLTKKHWKVKWEKIEKLHLTVAFLGDIENPALQLIKVKIKKTISNLKPFIISFKKLGCFPTFDWPRLVWIGLKGDLTTLAKLQKSISFSILKMPNLQLPVNVCQGLKRPFIAHLTMGRLDKKISFGERKEIGRQLKKLEDPINLEFLIDKITVYESKLLPKGSKYFPLEIFKLKK